MAKSNALCIRALLLVLCLPAISLMSQVNVTTYHNDNARTGQNIFEPFLTPALLASGGFGRLFSVPVDGQVYAQPLVLSNVAIGGGTHNVVYVATEHDSLYAIDANNGTVYWKTSFINPPAINTASSGLTGVNCSLISPEYGITSTPAISAATGTIYVVPVTVRSGTYSYQLHAVDVTTGAEQPGSPVQIQATLNGITFDPFRHLNRPALLLENGHIILAWGSYCDHARYFGWVMSYNASTLVQEAVGNVNLNSDPSGRNAGIWMSGAGVASDANGNLYLATGNGDFGGGFPYDFGSSILKLGPPSGGTFPMLDWFTPFSENDLNDPNDEDLGSGGVLLIPTQPGSAHPNLLVQMGKDGVLHLIDINHLGHYCSSCTSVDTNIVQEIPNANVGVFGAPAYWGQQVYFGGATDGGGRDQVKAFFLNPSVSQLRLVSQTPESFSYPTPTPSVSANGLTNGILWVLDNSNYANRGPAYLHAYDATNLAVELYSNSNACRDTLGGAVKFTVPTVANGEVFVGGSRQLTVLGQLTSTSLSPPSLNFGSHLSTDPAQQLTTTLTNTGTHTLFSNLGKLSSPFAVSGTTCTATLGPKASCSITVQFTPSQGKTGSNSQTLVINDSAVSGCQKIPATATIS